MPRIGIIGGSGLYQIEGLEEIREVRVETPFGDPSDLLILGRLEGREVLFLPRHGRGHRILPAEVNNRANIWALKSLDTAWIISVSAVGSLKPGLKPQDLVIVDQFVDRTNQARPNTFFGGGIAAHITFAHPLCESVGQILYTAAREMGASIHWGGTYVNMEGPAFSTLAESQLYRSWGMDVVGMTQMNEARLAREAEICYATLAMVTDYDCWWEAETGQTVSVELVVENLRQSSALAKELIRRSIASFPWQPACACQEALAGAIITERGAWPQESITRLGPILKKYL
ncbi:MAG TPA: S-methyl-5'-thioadenosine phosphorylase [bacterium]|nr:S-methyl-5'-thioadenosine phosphorylase [bacterium]HOC25400.1 S-methyl-5'-thioadenosine phosphorylase [bacterium]HOH06250.1 S-methyl-5'-thioadenosine phosphorylase [bacterium]HOY43486.1 S-methyl-5'-thioadenosine phosphorylase [bacterium]HPG81681.1 S-methyl-5'-thioadenosine phosphorylase [bacterium]